MHLTTTLKMIQPVQAEKFGKKTTLYNGAKQCYQKKHTRQMRGHGKKVVRQGILDIDLEKVLLEIEAKEKVEAELRDRIEAIGDKIEEARQAFYDLIRQARDLTKDLTTEAREEVYERFWWPTLE